LHGHPVNKRSGRSTGADKFMRVLLVEDEPALRRQLSQALGRAGYAVDHADNGEEAQHLGVTEPYDAIVLDLGLPRLDGLTVLARWRQANVSTPVLILTARDRWSEKVKAFDTGADDYVAKPFSMEELLARLRALIRRAAGHSSAVLRCGPLRVDTSTGRTTVDGDPVRLTAQEFRLLTYLMHHQDKIVSRTELIEHIYDQSFERDSNTIEVFVGRLRKKLGIDAIETVRGLGYRLAAPRDGQ
jgi:two-component system, OmpR family, response regulator